MLAGLIGVASERFRMTVGEGKIRFDVEDRCAVHQVGTFDVDDGAVGRIELNPADLDRGEADGVGAEGRAGGKDSHAHVAAETRGTDGGGPGEGV